MTLIPIPVVATKAQCPAHAMLADAPGSATWPTSASPQLYPCPARPESWSARGTSPCSPVSGLSEPAAPRRRVGRPGGDGEGTEHRGSRRGGGDASRRCSPPAGKNLAFPLVPGQLTSAADSVAGVAGDAGVAHHPRLGEVPLAGAVEHAAVVPHHEVAGRPAVPVDPRRPAGARRAGRRAARRTPSGSRPGIAWAWRPMNSAGRPVTGCTFTSGRSCAGSSMP